MKGAVAGAVAVWLMDRVTSYMYRHEDPIAKEQEKMAQKGGKYAPYVAVNKMAKGLNIQMNERQEHIAAKTLHYLLGIIPATSYAILRHKVKGLDKANGLLFGLGLFIVQDEILTPLTGVASGPLAYPWQAHARGLAGHLTVGAATDMTVRALDKVLSIRNKAVVPVTEEVIVVSEETLLY